MSHPAAAGTVATPPPLYQIHHYPARLIDTRVLRSGRRLTLRPVLPQDSLLIGQLMAALSPGARRARFHAAVNLSARRLLQMSCVDYAQHLALVVTTEICGEEFVIAEARYSVLGDAQTAEFALLVDERWQRQGVGAWALQALLRAAKSAGLQQLQGEVLSHNTAMLALMQRLRFGCMASAGAGGESGVRKLVLHLAPMTHRSGTDHDGDHPLPHHPGGPSRRPAWATAHPLRDRLRRLSAWLSALARVARRATA